MRLEDNYEKLDSFASYEDNWDGYGAFKYNKNLLNNLRGILSKLVIQPQLFPSASGVIQLEFYIDYDINRTTLAIRYSLDEKLDTFIATVSSGVIESKIDNNIDSINKKILDFYSSKI